MLLEEREDRLLPATHPQEKKKGGKVKPLAVAHKLGEAEGKRQCYVKTLAGTRQLLNRHVKGLFGIMYPPFHKLQLS